MRSALSTVVIRADLGGRVGAATFERAAAALGRAEPLLGAAGCVIGDVDERALLAGPPPLPLRVWLAHGGARLVACFHHPAFDVHAARQVMVKLAALCSAGGVTACAHRLGRCSGAPHASGCTLHERRLPPAELARLRARAATFGATASQLCFVALLVALCRHERAQLPLAALPASLELRADGQELRAATGLLAAGDLGAVLERLRAPPLTLSLARWLRRSERRGLRLSASSDLGAAPPLCFGAAPVSRLRLLVAPAAGDHGGALFYLDGAELCLSLTMRRGAGDGERLLDALCEALGARGERSSAPLLRCLPGGRRS